LGYNKRVLLKGHCILKVESGTVRVLGCTLHQNDSIEIHSHENFPLLEIRSINQDPEPGSDLDPMSTVSFHKVVNCSLRLDRRFGDSEEGYKDRVLSFSKDIIDKIGVLREILSMVPDHLRRVMIIGERKRGKSTLASFLVNQFLDSENVFFMETDLGQTLNSVPGFIHLCKVQNALVTNNTVWTGSKQQSEQFWSKYVGDYSPEVFPSIYEQKVAELLETTSSQARSGVMVINTNGYVQGVGLLSLQQIIELIKPHVILEISSSQDTICKQIFHQKTVSYVKSRADFINSKMQVLTVQSSVPIEIKSRFGSMKELRNSGMRKYFEDNCVDFFLPFGRLRIVIHENNKRKHLSVKTTGYEKMALMLVNSIAAICLSDNSEVPILICDFDMKKQQVEMRIQEDYLSKIPAEEVTMSKSEHMDFDLSRTFQYNNWREEIESNQMLGKRIFCSGPQLGVGAIVARRKVSNRKGR
jgi:polynucleotide 5'-kinase involved in rRNA processing